MTKAYFVGGLQFRPEYHELKEWVEKTPGASFVKSDGISWINGAVFYSSVEFERREDLLACVLTFPGLIYADNR
jgi:hypothetical protein